MTTDHHLAPTHKPVPALDYAALAPDLIRELRALTQRLGSLGVDEQLHHLVELRVFQINGCAFCIDRHARAALHAHVSIQQVIGLATWQNGGLYDERTRSHGHEDARAGLTVWLTDTDIVHLTLIIALATAWNRIAGGLGRLPEPWPASP